jgi:hypothetical protein
MIRSHHTKAGSFSCAGEKFSTLAEAGAVVESPEGRNWELATSINERRASAKTSGLLGTRIS